MIKHKDPSLLTLAVSFTKELNHGAENCYSGFLKATKWMKESILQKNLIELTLIDFQNK